LRRCVATVSVAAIVLVGTISCDQELPTPRKTTSWGVPASPSPSAVAAANCSPVSDDERTAVALSDIVASADQVGAQFAVDSLRLITASSERVLVCLLTDERPLRVHQVMWLNRGPHRFELIAHYDARVVGDVAAIVLGAPPGRTAPCYAGEQSDRKACAAAWRLYRDAQRAMHAK
jgi:hypothetical protein